LDFRKGSFMKANRHLLVRSGVFAILLAGVWNVGCGAQSPDVPDDDDENNTGGTGMGGTPAQGGVSGAFPSGGTSGAFPSGGTAGTPPAGGTAGTFPTGGTAGTFPTGGTAGTPAGGSAGTGTCGPTTATAGEALISDLEDGTNAIEGPRVGYWYTYNDGTTCAQMPAPDPSGATPFPPTAAAGNGMYAAKTSGAACGTWGAGMGFDLANCNSMSTPYDAGVFNGISFWYKSTTALRVIVGTTGIIPTTRGGTCVPGGMGMECDNGHGLDLDPAPAGMTISVPFTMLSQSFGQMIAFNKAQIVNIQWQVAQALPFDFTIDDVSFTP
jgi:hypothetical protein